MKQLNNQEGAIMLLALAFMAVAISLTLGLSKLGIQVKHNIQAQNAADAAAISGASFLKRHLNEVSKLNQKIRIANQIIISMELSILFLKRLLPYSAPLILTAKTISAASAQYAKAQARLQDLIRADLVSNFHRTVHFFARENKARTIRLWPLSVVNLLQRSRHLFADLDLKLWRFITPPAARRKLSKGMVLKRNALQKLRFTVCLKLQATPSAASASLFGDTKMLTDNWQARLIPKLLPCGASL